MKLYHQERGIQIYHGDSLAEPLPGMCDLLCVDAPYSEKTHAGNDAVAGLCCEKRIPYKFWTPRNVRAAVRAWHQFTRGWMVSITDDTLAPHWAHAMRRAGRYVFQYLPAVIVNCNVRQLGDGPASWTRWIVVSRPRCAPYCTWGALQGAYIVRPEKLAVTGGKPRDLMRALIRDYSREGDVVCDPCCGGGTTLRAAVDWGRTAIGIDISEEHCAISAGRRPLIEAEGQRMLPL